MSEISKLIKTTGNELVIGYPLLSLLHFFWMLSMGKSIYWDGYNLLTGIAIFLIVAAFPPFLVSLFLSNLGTGWRILASLFAFPLLCVSAFFWLDLPFYHQVNEVQFDRHKYLLAYHNSIYADDSYNWYLFECAPAGMPCKSVLVYTDEYGEFYNDTSVTDLVIDERADELHVVIDSDLLYTVGYPSRKYNPMLRSIQRGNYRYNLSQYEDVNTDSMIYNLYECNLQYACTRIPFVYSISTERAAEIRQFFVEIDERTNEVHVLRQFERESAELIFSYGDQPRCYGDGCSIPEE